MGERAMAVGLHPIEQAVLQYWKTLRSVYRFFRHEFERMNHNYFSDQLPIPQFQIRRTWLPHGVTHDGHTMAYYDPPDKTHPARISFYPTALLNKNDARIALLHEMIHHWEATRDEMIDGPYPFSIDETIVKQHSSARHEKAWRSKHSSRFIHKAHQLATELGVATEDLLFRK
jgi:hypothetical protein